MEKYDENKQDNRTREERSCNGIFHIFSNGLVWLFVLVGWTAGEKRQKKN